jgi:hypothetical protein
VERAALLGEALDVRCRIFRLAERAEVGPARIIEKDDDEIRLLRLLRGTGGVRSQTRTGGGL